MAASELEEQILRERIAELEEAVLDLSASIQNLSRGMTEMQKVIVRIATNQQQIAERVATWPFVKVESRKRKKPGGSIDNNDI